MIISESENIWLSFHNYRKGNRMKKTFNLLLSASMVLGLASPIYAQEGTFAEVAETTAATVKEVSTKDELVQAASDVKDGDTIKLIQNIELNETLNIAGKKKITLDLNGKNLTLAKNTNKVLMNVGNSITNDSTELLLTDSSPVKGKIESSDNIVTICVRKGAKMITRDVNIVFSDENHAASNAAIQLQGELIVEEGANIKSSEGGVFVLQEGSKLDVNAGKIEAAYYAVTGNGQKIYENTVININGGTLLSETGVGIYHPQKGTLTLNGGTITGLSGVQMCSGNLVVPENSTVKVIATGEDKITDKKEDDGTLEDGRAIALIKRSYPGGDPTAQIAGGSFVSEKADTPILAYTWKDSGKEYSEWADASKNATVSGGAFNKPFDDEFVKTASFLSVDGTYYVATGDTLNNLIANADESIVILKNITNVNVPGGVKVENQSGGDVTVNGTTVGNNGSINIPTTSGGGATVKLNPVYRAYNPNNGEHLYTVDEKEYKHVASVGWDAEGVAFMAEEEKNGQALYRVYNPNSGLHHYTLDEKEKNTLVSLGWHDEKVAWYTSKKPQSAPVYRVYNPNDGNHHYTMNKQEKDVLVSYGWQDEGIAFRTAPIEK